MGKSACTQALPWDSSWPLWPSGAFSESRWRLPWPPDFKCNQLLSALSLSPILLSFSLLFLSPRLCLNFLHSSFYHMTCYLVHYCMNLSSVTPHRKTSSMRTEVLFSPILFTTVYKLPKCHTRSMRICWMSQEMDACSHQKILNVAKHFLYFTIFEEKIFQQRLPIPASLNQQKVLIK